MLDLAFVNYEILNHTADLCIRVYGDSLENLLVNAGKAMMDLITNRKIVRNSEEIPIKIHGETDEELLVNWLQEILYNHEVKKMVFKDFKVQLINKTFAKGKAYGETIDKERHELYSDIKAVTYHNLKIVTGKDKLRVDIVFDI